MKITTNSTSIWILSATALCLAVALQACSGGGGSAASSGSTSQLASGVVTGFGSVFVDGVELEDVNASVVTENYDGSTTNTVLQMGQRVRVTHDGKGTANKVTLDAAAIGSVSSIITTTTSSTLTVAGQKVTVVTDATICALTVWGGGYSSVGDALPSVCELVPVTIWCFEWLLKGEDGIESADLVGQLECVFRPIKADENESNAHNRLT
jgi:hypothetical protein